MDISKLTELLNKANDLGIKTPTIPDWAIGTDIERSIERHTSSDMDEEILQFLSQQEELHLFNEKMFNSGTTHTLVSFKILLQWLLFNTTRCGSQKTTEIIEKYLALDYNPAIEILAITGAETDEPVHLDDEIALIPFSTLPPSGFKDSLDPPLLKKENLLKMGVSPFAIMNNMHNPPTAALIRKIKLFPQTLEPQEIPRPIDTKPLYEACELLTLISNCTPLPAAHTYILEDWVPCSGNLGSSWGSSIHDIVNLQSCKLSIHDNQQLKDTYKKFKALTQPIRDKLRVPIQRLNQARRRQNLADKAIDVGVAFESLFLGDRSEKEQISYTFRLRAAWYLGDTSESRQQLIKRFNKIYTLRSQAVHKGTIDSKVRIDGIEIEINEFLSQADSLCVTSIRKIIEDRGFPNWDTLVLG